MWKNLEVSLLPPICPLTTRRSLVEVLPMTQYQLPMARVESLLPQVLELLRGGCEQSPGTKAVDYHPSIFFLHHLVKTGWEGVCQLAHKFFLPRSEVFNYTTLDMKLTSASFSHLGKSRSACGPFPF